MNQFSVVIPCDDNSERPVYENIKRVRIRNGMAKNPNFNRNYFKGVQLWFRGGAF